MSQMRYSGVRLALGMAALATTLMVDPVPVHAQNVEITIMPYVGKTTWSKHVNIERKPIYGASVGALLRGRVGIEGTFGMVSSNSVRGTAPWVDAAATGPSVKMKSLQYGADLLYNFLSSEFTPYVAGGWRHYKFTSGSDAAKTVYNYNGFDAALGARLNVTKVLGVRAEVRDVMFRFKSPPASNPPGESQTHSVFYNLGLQLTLGHKGPAPPPPPPAPVTIVVDAPPPPPPVDSDGDGVMNDQDKCPDTPRGVLVDASGCPLDSDGDGVYDGLDKCPDTPRGATVDASGCPRDSDGDGVYDGLDKCPDTPQGARVDRDGCPIVVNERETELLDTGKITARDIHFATAKWDILPQSYESLSGIGKILEQWPQLRIEIGGHCDARGSDAYNLDLSNKRAHSVLTYLLEHFPKINREQYTAAGYGESQPVGDNKTVEGMAMNRRVEFKVLNTEELTKARERRHMLPK
ncbi:MAG: OmpA family protein [Candidatus Eisenbacteria bacterium]|nr:OmpA family protein [Candidatus Eisenbacteria bacterium]